MKCVAKCNRALLKVFYNYGHLVGSHPFPFIFCSVILFAGLALGLLNINQENDMEVLYTPMGSTALSNRETLIDTFPDQTAHNYFSFSLNELIPMAQVFFKSKDGKNILDEDVLNEIKNFTEKITAVTVTSEGSVLTYYDICARSSNSCVLSGDFIFTPEFRTSMDAGNLTYPYSTSFLGIDISRTIGDTELLGGVILRSASIISITYPLRLDLYDEALTWEGGFLEFMESNAANLGNLDVAYSASQSLNDELDKGTRGDIIFFTMTLVLMVTYAAIVSSGGNCVSTRAFLSIAGVFATGLGIAGAVGFVTLTGIQFVNMVGIMPFLLLGIGVDDMFLLMSSWSETTGNLEQTIPQRIGMVFKKAGIGITITSVTDFLSFAVGATSIFLSVRNFCIYTGVGVIMCYLANSTFFGACLALHGRRVNASRHTVTFQKVDKSPGELMEDGRNCCFAYACGGSIPKESMADQSSCERGPRILLPNLVMKMPVRFIILVVFSFYLAISIWGCSILKQGLDLKDLVKTSSYVYKYQVWQGDYFGRKIPIQFAITETQNYRHPETYNNMVSVLNKAKSDSDIDPMVEECWLTSYAQSPFYNTASDDLFISGLKTYLNNVPKYYNDIVFNNKIITASRCHVYSKALIDTSKEANLMVRMRDIAYDSPLAIIAYHPSFIYFEQFILILPTTLKTVGITLAVMMVVTAIFLPHPLIVLLVMVQVLMIVTGIFGFLSFWDLTLSSITMIHLIMSVGFSVDFCAHICTAYMVSEKTTREERAKDAIVHASGPILNGGMSSFVGILGLLFSESFIFQSFFKIMLLVIGFGIVHAVFFVPVVLSFIGPKTYMEKEEDDDDVQANGHAKWARKLSSVSHLDEPENCKQKHVGVELSIMPINGVEKDNALKTEAYVNPITVSRHGEQEQGLTPNNMDQNGSVSKTGESVNKGFEEDDK